MSLKKFPSDWSKLHHTQVKANIEYLLNNYKRHGVAMSGCDDNTVRIGDDIKIVFNTDLDCYTINGRLVTDLTKTLYGPLDELFKVCKAYHESIKTHRAQQTKSRQNISAWWDDTKPFELLFGGFATLFAVIGMVVCMEDNYTTTVQEKVKEKLQQEYPDYSGYEGRKQQITDSIKDCTNKFNAWRNRREKGN